MNSPKEIAQYYVTAGVAKTKLSIVKMLLMGIMAGMFVALAGVGSTVAYATVADSPIVSLGRLLSSMIFPAALVMVLLAGSELFTGNTLIIIPVLEREIKLRAMLKNWLFVYTGNFIGSIFVAALTAYGGTYSLFGNGVAVTAINTAVLKVSLSFADALFRGILCNFLVCIAVWISLAAKDVAGKIIGLFMPIMLFVLSAYEHSIANMYYITTGLFAVTTPVYRDIYVSVHGEAGLDALTWAAMFTRNIIPVTLGNIIGGTVIVGMTYWFLYLYDEKKAAK